MRKDKFREYVMRTFGSWDEYKEYLIFMGKEYASKCRPPPPDIPPDLPFEEMWEKGETR